MHSYK